MKARAESWYIAPGGFSGSDFDMFWIVGSNMGQKKLRYDPLGPIWLHTARNVINFGCMDVPRSFMATHLVRILSPNGTLEFRAPLAHFFRSKSLGSTKVSLWSTQCLCGTHTVSLWHTHSVSLWDTHRGRAGRRRPGRAGRGFA